MAAHSQLGIEALTTRLDGCKAPANKLCIHPVSVIASGPSFWTQIIGIFEFFSQIATRLHMSQSTTVPIDNKSAIS